MKTYITLFTILFTLVATSFTANAQYQYVVDDKCVEVKFNKVPEEFVNIYKETKESIQLGKILCFSGMILDGAGIYVLASKPCKDDKLFTMPGSKKLVSMPAYKYNNIIGYSVTAIGLTLNIIGSVIWYKGETKLDNLKLEYAITNGGLILTF